MATETLTPPPIDADERVVEEVHCIYTGAPIPAIPSWYANVNVRFFCEAAKAKSPALAAPLDVAVPAVALEDGDVEPALDDIDDAELELDDAELDAADTDPDADPAADDV